MISESTVSKNLESYALLPYTTKNDTTILYIGLLRSNTCDFEGRSNLKHKLQIKNIKERCSLSCV